ncbi:MAG: HAMP domain-containing histidine kinase [Elusimicrobia bacterium]|nr:HAMP domain-containing histidine kinase [Elusimicrobiota bacterium]
MTLRSKFSGLASAVVLAVVTCSAVLQATLELRSARVDRERRIAESAHLLSGAKRTAAGLAGTLSAMPASAMPRRVFLLDPQGKVVFDSQETASGSSRFLTDERSQAALRRLEPGWLEYREGARAFREFVAPAGIGPSKTVLRLVFDLSAGPTAGHGLRIAWVALSSLAVGLLGVAWLAANLNRTLRKLASAARHVGAGELSYQVRTDRTDELGQIAAEFNLMGRKLAELEEMKQRFLESVTHDLKSPLAAIDGYASILAKGMCGPVNDTQRRHLESMQDSSERLSRMIDDILDLSKLEAGQMEFEFAPMRLEEAAREVRGLLSVLADRYEVALSVEAGDGLPEISGDRDSLIRVITNLVSNALKFTPKGGRVSISVRRADGGVALRVKDTGCGIPEEKLHLMFTKFFQVQETKAQARAVGTGLGLTICRRIVEAHGGRIWVESVWRQGSTFSFALPAKPPEA